MKFTVLSYLQPLVGNVVSISFWPPAANEAKFWFCLMVTRCCKLTHEWHFLCEAGASILILITVSWISQNETPPTPLPLHNLCFLGILTKKHFFANGNWLKIRPGLIWSRPGCGASTKETGRQKWQWSLMFTFSTTIDKLTTQWQRLLLGRILSLLVVVIWGNMLKIDKWS